MNDALGMPQTAVVLGGTSDIAGSILSALVERRLKKVVLVGRDKAKLGEVAAKLRGEGAEQVDIVISDITFTEGHVDLAEQCGHLLGEIDLVIVAAAILGDQPASEVDPLVTAQIIETNFTGPAAALTAFAARLRSQGHGKLLVISSVAGVRVRRSNFTYGSSKAGLDSFSLGLAEALRGSGASLVLLRPGWVATRMTEGLKPAPLATTPDKVAEDVVGALGKGTAIVWSPGPLKYMFAVLKLLPAFVWRRMPDS